MKKKLYKAKKNWVIGLIAGAVLLLGGNAAAQADTNTTPATENVMVASQNNGQQSTAGLTASKVQADVQTPASGASTQQAQPTAQSLTAPASQAGANNTEPTYNASDHGNYAYLDQHTLDNNGQLHVSGWHATNGAQGKDYRYVILLNGQTHREIARKNITDSTVKREDVAKVHNVYKADQSGFNVSFDLANVIATTPSLQIVDRYTNDPAGNGQSVDYWFTPFAINHNNYGSLDGVMVDNNQLKLNGWHANNSAANKKYHYVILLDNTNGNREIGRQEVKTIVNRPDVAKAFPDIYNAGKSGFAAAFTLSNRIDLNHRLQVVDRYTDDPAGNGNAIDYWFSPFGGNYSNHAYLDSFNPTDGKTLKISGWHANDVSKLENNHFIILFDNTTRKQVASAKAVSVSRPDVAKVYPNVKTAGQAGFQAVFNLKDIQLIPGNSYSVVSRYSSSAQGNGDQGSHTDYWLNPVQLKQRASYIDNIQMTGDGLQLSGWMVDDASLTRTNPYVIVLNNGKEIARQKLALTSRPDVARVYSNVYNSANSGFKTLVKFAPKMVDGNMQVLLRFTDDPAGNGKTSDQ
ncbi:MAG: KxYKxGKxW signal peptide domain-containing protein, partial [Limosilactobacillus sp.]